MLAKQLLIRQKIMKATGVFVLTFIDFGCYDRFRVNNDHFALRVIL